MIKTFVLSDANSMLEFEQGRIALISNYKDKLIENYTKFFQYQDQTAFSIAYKDNKPFLFSTIFRCDWWPDGCYRILNRIWKLSRQSHLSKTIDPLFLMMAENQIDWLKENTNFCTAIITREHDSRSALENVCSHLNNRKYIFSIHKSQVWVCYGPAKNCFQDILYTGDPGVFLNWPHLND